MTWTPAPGPPVASSGFTQCNDGSPVPAEDDRLRALLDAFLDEELTLRPQFATTWGLDTGQHAAARSALNDFSVAARAGWLASRRSRLERLKTIERHRLTEAGQLDHDVATWQFEITLDGGQRFPFGEGLAGFGFAPYSPYVFSQLSGPYQSIPDFLMSKHPITSSADADAYLSRLNAFGRALDDSTEALRVDAARRVLPPDFVLDTATRQLSKLLVAPPDSHQLVVSLADRAAAAGLVGGWAESAAAIIGAQVYPAVDRQLKTVAVLRRGASHDAGAWKLPDGAAYYEGALRFQTTTGRSADEIHRIGMDQVSELTARLDTELRAQGLGNGTVAERLSALSRRPEQLYPNTDAGRAALLAAANAQLEAVRAQLHRVFRSRPEVPVEIVRVPPEIEDGSMNGYFQPPSLDGSRPGRFYINLKDTAEWPKFTLPTLTYHETIPGHQWQGAVARQATELPMLRRLTGAYSAYMEGWALYAEHLADDLGQYEGDPLGRIGLLQSLLFRAVRLVIDTGIHARRWSRERAIDCMVEFTAMPRLRVEREIDRYCVWPGQACSYLIGYIEWLRFRDAAKARAGAAFDIKAFHEVLRRGPMPLVVLEQLAERVCVAG